MNPLKPVAVLGSGPAGLMAAYAVAMRAHRPVIILSSGGKSRLGGAQFLHKSIEGLTEGDGTRVRYVFRGDGSTYQAKVYGGREVPFVSFDRVPEAQPAWSLSETYDRLWDIFGGNVMDNQTVITAKWVDENRDNFSAMLSTIPLTQICCARAGLLKENHAFTVQTIRIHPQTLEEVPDNTIIYDGTPDRTWYRTSRLFGVGGTEWSIDAKTPPGIAPLFQDHKPIHTTCDCWTADGRTPVVRLGRRGKWKKGELTHDAYHGAIRALAEIGLFG